MPVNNACKYMNPVVYIFKGVVRISGPKVEMGATRSCKLELWLQFQASLRIPGHLDSDLPSSPSLLLLLLVVACYGMKHGKRMWGRNKAQVSHLGCCKLYKLIFRRYQWG